MCFQKMDLPEKLFLEKRNASGCGEWWRWLGGGGDKDGRRSILILGAQTQGHPRHPPLVGTHGTHRCPDPDLGRRSSCQSFFSQGFGGSPSFLACRYWSLQTYPLVMPGKKDMFWNFLKTNSWGGELGSLINCCSFTAPKPKDNPTSFRLQLRMVEIGENCKEATTREPRLQLAHDLR